MRSATPRAFGTLARFELSVDAVLEDAATEAEGGAALALMSGRYLVFRPGEAATLEVRSFDAVARALVESPLLVVRSDPRWKSLQEFVAEAKMQPGKVTIANSGVGSHTHISSVALFRPAGVQAVDVPFAAAQVVPSLLGGQVDAVVQLPAALAP